MYEIHEHNRTCKKKPLKVDFQPMAITKETTLVGQFVLGSSSGPRDGLLLNSWAGDLPDKTGEHVSSVTEFGCIPVISVSTLSSCIGGDQVSSFLDNIKGITDPSQLNPPDFCRDAETKDSEKEPTDFLSLFLTKK
ncbi:ependymin-1-like [Nematolebias whitei]|uniref:ependymin-1-like n=1 Tax=Nematolebias whitei TaxID=451745 RepID=UPI001897A491|nr:ependymin-1-like [Nematolebias whitei]